ncbi:ABC-type nitrate/sulfonate/bicarbonate transport system permease component [Herbihabitans rhizosphaerae]|uniref:ABC-type nitrate/sulfonate/bicarbonate transport system permease component n=1 Tax=Herbihabitans rhizosphaerae TaxID=1872711 RepID=A0A4Q7KVK8_9PSEU|nr:ABC transporter permease [Herbihabitans rhizosphaerae]RZS41059.1 ABC-type nitrate/sulfonate/bicarbonate transport system permease component [Herbihabitans rhizosphaerae]
MTITRRLGGLAHRWALFAFVVVAWELVTRSVDDLLFPPPSEIARATADTWFSGKFAEDVLPSLGRMLGGWAIAAVIGIALGVALGRSRVAMDYAGPAMHFFRAIPPPLLVPFFLVTMGLDGMHTGTIVFGAVWPILLNSVDGARSVDAVKIDTARTFRLSRAQWMVGVVLPAASPKIFAGLRVSLSIALILMVISELVGAANGIGRELKDAQESYQNPAMWTWIVLLGLLGYLFNSMLLIAERHLLGWRSAPSRTA